MTEAHHWRSAGFAEDTAEYPNPDTQMCGDVSDMFDFDPALLQPQLAEYEWTFGGQNPYWPNVEEGTYAFAPAEGSSHPGSVVSAYGGGIWSQAGAEPVVDGGPLSLNDAARTQAGYTDYEVEHRQWHTPYQWPSELACSATEPSSVQTEDAATFTRTSEAPENSETTQESACDTPKSAPRKRKRGPIHNALASERPCYPVGRESAHDVMLTDATCFCGRITWSQPSKLSAGCSWPCLELGLSIGSAEGSDLMLCTYIESVDRDQIGHLVSFKIFSTRSVHLPGLPRCGNCTKVSNASGANLIDQHPNDLRGLNSSQLPSPIQQVLLSRLSSFDADKHEFLSRLNAGELAPAEIRRGEQSYGVKGRRYYQCTVSCSNCTDVSKVDVYCKHLATFSDHPLLTSPECAKEILSRPKQTMPWVVCTAMVYNRGSIGHLSLYHANYSLEGSWCGNHRRGRIRESNARSLLLPFGSAGFESH